MTLLLLAACQEYEISKYDEEFFGTPMIEVSPLLLDYGGVSAGSQAIQSFVVANVGDATLEVEPIVLQGSGSFTLVTGADAHTVAPGKDFTVDVAYTPASELDSGYAVVRSDDKGNSEVIVELMGIQVNPQLEVDPPELDFGNVELDGTETLFVTLTNVGDGTLEISAISGPNAPFSASWPLPISLDAGVSAEVEVSLSPTEYGAFNDAIIIASNDPDGAATLDLLGSSASQPIAVCSVSPNPVATLHETATFYGSGSYDPMGLSITQYSWALTSKPAGSTASMPGGNSANRSGFVADLAGSYEAELKVMNSAGIWSEACHLTLDSVPEENLWIELFWTHSGDDMDMHLVAPSGSLLSGLDCYYGNCVGWGLDWGVLGDSSDNPVLDLDDISGTGPENINIEDPASGVYTVYVHDFPGSAYQPGQDVTVRIYIAGVLSWTGTKNIAGEDDYVPFAEVDWPSGTITPL
jgi:hypothetical protein